MLQDKRPFYLFFLLIYFSFLAGSISAQNTELDFLQDDVTYLWPTNASHQISSTFAETRSAHFHAGLDIRTFGREGFQVYATRDGIVHRIATGPYGYGNVVYLKHNDGSFSVYAHLNRFEPELQEIVDSIRFQDYSFDIDVKVEELNIEYNQGDVIAFTGSTGIGPPHLHFELRTPDFKPFNPFLTNIRVIDTIPPVFRQLALEQKNNSSLHPASFNIYNARFNSGSYDFGEINVEGPVGLSVNVHDRADSTPNIYAVYSLTMIHESDTLFNSEVNFFPDKYRRQMFLDRSYQILAQTRSGFQRLFKVYGNKLPFYRNVKNNGVLYFPGETIPLRIVATDIFGNQSFARVTLNFSNTGPSDFTAPYVPAYPSIPEPLDINFQTFHSTISSYSLREPITLPSSDSIINQRPIQKHYTPYRISQNSIIQTKLAPGRKTTFSSKDKRLWIDFPAEALYDTLHLQMEMIETENGIYINFEPDRLPIQEEIRLRYILPEYFKDRGNIALYSVDKFRNRNVYRQAEISNGILTANLREISSLFITVDNQSPWIGNVRVGRDLAQNYNIIFPVRDSGSGIDHTRSEITINNEKGLTGYNPDKNHLYFYKPGFTPQENNSVSILVYDGAGNRSEKTVSFRYTP